MPQNPLDVDLQDNTTHTIDMYNSVIQMNDAEADESVIYLLQVDIRTQALDRMVQFYQTLLEVPNRKLEWKNVDSHRGCILHMPYGKLLLIQDDTVQSALKPGFALITFSTGGDSGVDKAYQTLKAMNGNYKITGPFFDWDNRYKIIVEDPDGNTIALCD